MTAVPNAPQASSVVLADAFVVFPNREASAASRDAAVLPSSGDQTGG
jgi:hypothetical protein